MVHCASGGWAGDAMYLVFEARERGGTDRLHPDLPGHPLRGQVLWTDQRYNSVVVHCLEGKLAGSARRLRRVASPPVWAVNQIPHFWHFAPIHKLAQETHLTYRLA